MILMSTNNIHFHDKNSTEGSVACVCVCVWGGGGGGWGGGGGGKAVGTPLIHIKYR